MITQYNAKDCTITVDGVYITGVSEDMVTGSKDEEFVGTAVGAQGDVVVNVINNPLGTVTLTIQSTSPQKAMLLDMARESRNVSIWVTNKNLKERFGGSNAMIKNFPELAHTNEAGDREFEFQVFDYTVESV